MPHTPLRSDASACASCGAALAGPYCHACGEKRLDRSDYTLRHWLEHAVDAFTHFDLKVPRSLWSLLRRPGRMTADVLAGRRVRWARPLQTFLIANVLYYIYASTSGLNTFETPLRYQLSSAYGGLFESIAEAQAARLGVSLDAYAVRFDALTHTLSKTLVLFFAPVFALAFGALARGSRRYALEHATVGLHFAALVLLVTPIPLWVMIPAEALGVRLNEDTVLTIGSAFIVTTYAAFFFRRVYDVSRLGAVWRGAVVLVAFYAALVLLYRPFLFAVTSALL